MFKIFANAWRVGDIRKKLLFIFLLLFIYRFGSVIPLPGLDMELLHGVRTGFGGPDWDPVQNVFMMLMGGGIGSIFAMGIAPYITASIIMQLLTYAIPQIKQMQQDGEDGRKKIEQFTRYLAVALAALQAAGMVFTYTNFHGSGYNLFRAEHQNMLVYIIATIAMMTGTIFIMWLAELITERGIGQGASFLIFANILAGMPRDAMSMWMHLTDNLSVTTVVIILGLLAIFVAIIAFVVMVHEGERRIPVQYSRKAASGRGMYGNQNSYIPLKVNIAGVLSIIFAMSLLGFPAMIGQFFPNNTTMTNISRVLDVHQNPHAIGIVIYVLLIFAFTHFYTSFAVNPVEMAENMKKNGGFIPGIRPGKPTSDFIQVTVNRLSWIGSVFYALIAIMPVILQLSLRRTGMNLGFGGTSLLIVTGVALEFVKQLESQLLMRHYKGFLE